MSVDNLIYEIHRFIEFFLNRGDFESVDAILKILNPEVESVDGMLSYLTATLPAKDKLTEREEFYNRVERYFKTNVPEFEMLLQGLK